jgi:hypothetical protein
VVALAAWFDGNADEPTVVSTPDELDEVLDLVAGQGGPRIVELLVHDDPARAIFDVGLHGQRGTLYFSNPDHPDGCYSRGNEAASGPLIYYYMGSDTEYPANAELPLDTIRQAAHEYLTTGGNRPTNIDWQPSPW